MRGSTVPSEVEALLADAEARAGGALWEREWAATTLRAIEKSFGHDAPDELRVRVTALRARLSAADDEALAPLRSRLEAGTLSAADFRAELNARPSYEWDAFTQRLLAVADVPEEETDRPAGMVHYLPSPMNAILEIVDALTPADVFYDIGSGLGLVTMLVSWLSGAKAKGVEREPAFHRRAVELAERLRFGDVEYLCGDAREIDYADGTVFYIYDTFRGEILEDMIRVLEVQARLRTIRVISRGESNGVLERVEWLAHRGTRGSRLLFLQSNI